jgi:uridylate kinase
MIVVKAGGNAIWPRTAAGIDRRFLESLLTFVRYLINQGETVVLVPGGVGGQHFINWARDAGCSDAEMNEVGCTLINAAALILSRYFMKRVGDAFRTCPIVAANYADLQIYSNSHNLVVAGVALPGAVTSDSLAALAAEHLGAKLIIIKSSYPYEAQRLEFAREGKRYISTKAITAHITSNNTPFSAGYHASLDYVCLRVLERARLQAQILSSPDLSAWCAGGPLNMLTIVA